MVPQAALSTPKRCFVTIGATASFDALIHKVLDIEVIRTLIDLGYNQLRLQYGKDGADKFERRLQEARHYKSSGNSIQITGFDFQPAGLSSEMVATKVQDNGQEGVVISHAGSGSILDALRINTPIIVVPNPELLDNHQQELADAVESQGLAVYGKLTELSMALQEIEKRRSRARVWPPVDQQGDGRGLIGVMDDQLGFVD